MTQGEWDHSTNLWAMLQGLGRKATKRKFRLFAAACCRRIWKLLRDKRSRRTVEIVERYADGLADAAALDAAGLDARQARLDAVAEAGARLPDFDYVRIAPGAAELAASPDLLFAAIETATLTAQVVAEVLSLPNPPLRLAESRGECCLLRELFGNPFRTVVVHPSWLAWNDQAVVKIASAIYEDRAFDRVPLLADALEDAGCTDADILSHCRTPGEHVRGCWVVDLLLGKE